MIECSNLGELNAQLKPNRVSLNSDDPSDDEQEDIDGVPKAGTRRRRRYYQIQLPKELQLDLEAGQSKVVNVYQVVPVLAEEISRKHNRKKYAIRRYTVSFDPSFSAVFSFS